MWGKPPSSLQRDPRLHYWIDDPLEKMELDALNSETGSSILAIGQLLKSIAEIWEVPALLSTAAVVAPESLLLDVGAPIDTEELMQFERASWRQQWTRTPRKLQDQMVIDAAKSGAGKKLDLQLGDPDFQNMEKWELRVESKNGDVTNLHFVKDKPGRGTWDPGGPPGMEDFKFKETSSVKEKYFFDEIYDLIFGPESP